jgi:Tol biopolymer transport system component
MRLTHTLARNVQPAWSPDRKQMVFVSEGDRQIVFLTGMMNDMHGPNPPTPMGNPVMAIEAQIIKDEARQKSPWVYRYRVKLKRLSQR